MKKLVNFVIEKKYLMLLLFIVFAITCVFLSQKVTLNYEISEYLPSNSNVRQGLDIMNKEFPNDSSTLNIMFDNLKDGDKENILMDLKKINGVKSITYDDSNKYNKDNHTLYILTINGDADSKEANKTYNKIISKYKDYEFNTSGDLDTRNKDVLPFYVLVAAVVCGTIILIIMCDSVVEVFLFLFTILIAVLLNKGTNIIFNSVSNITDSISAILQLALSMDYSIILMNRYNQEKKNIFDKSSAMKEALYKSFGSISSSSITTVVGLIALIFMSFTIGKDLGFVLAKGVICSLISTFFVLPGLILIFDKQIEKTKKKSPNIKINKLANFSYRFRFVFLILFIILFLGSYFLKGNLDIYYIDNDQDVISDIFDEENEIAVIYNNKDEDKVSKMCQNLDDNEQLNSVLCYGNTLNENLTYGLMNPKFKEFDMDTEIDDYLIKIVYYKYYNNNSNKISFNEFITFIKNVVYKNEDINIDKSMKDEVTRLEYFTSIESINKNRTVNDLSNIVGLDKNTIHDLIVLYNSKNTNTSINLKKFITFIYNNVINDSKYNISNESKNDINTLYNLISVLDKKMNTSELSKLFGIDNESINKIVLFIINNQDIDEKMSINEFTNIILNNYDKYKDYFDEETISLVKQLNTFSDSNIINNLFDSKSLSEMFSIDEDSINYIFMLNSVDKMDIESFINILLNNGFVSDDNQINNLILIKKVIELSKSNYLFNYEELSESFSIEESKTKIVFALQLSNNYKLTPKELINVVVNNKLIEDKKINKLYKIINNLNNSFNSSKMSELLELDKEKMDLLYGLYLYNNGSNTISLKNIINFISNNVINDRKYSNSINNSTKNKILGIKRIINSVLNNEKITSSEMINILNNISDNIDKEAIEIIYLYYGSYYQYDNNWTLTIEKLVEYLNSNILLDKRFDKYIKDDMRNKIIDAEDKVNEAKKKLVGNNYSRMIITSNMKYESNDVKALVKEIKEELGNTENYLIGNSPMAIEMNRTFGDELDLITLLTMIFIFIVVMITFKSFVIPFILVLTIQCAVFTTMGILSIFGGSVYFISLLIVQAVLMGATIDYAIVYTSYYLENREKFDRKEAIKEAYNKSVHTIVTSSLILCICTLIVAIFTSQAASRICETICEGALCATLLIIFVLPGVLSSIDKFLKRKNKVK